VFSTSAAQPSLTWPSLTWPSLLASKRIKREIDNDPSQEEYLGRVPEQAVRLTTILAAGCNGHRAKVYPAAMDWGDKLASALVTRMMKQSRDSLPQTTRGEFYEKARFSKLNYLPPPPIISQHHGGCGCATPLAIRQALPSLFTEPSGDNPI
jgi:hypothetical protein